MEVVLVVVVRFVFVVDSLPVVVMVVDDVVVSVDVDVFDEIVDAGTYFSANSHKFVV